MSNPPALEVLQTVNEGEEQDAAVPPEGEPCDSDQQPTKIKEEVNEKPAVEEKGGEQEPNETEQEENHSNYSDRRQGRRNDHPYGAWTRVEKPVEPPKTYVVVVFG